MKHKARYGASALGMLFLVIGFATFQAHGATYQKVSVPNSDQTSANGINNSGEVVGYWELTGTQIIEAFLLHNGTYTTFAFSGEPNTFAIGINDSGLIVGYVQTQNISTPYFGFTYENGSFTGLIKYPGAVSTQALGVNNAGQIVGTYVDLQNKPHGFLYSGGVYKTKDIANAISTVASGINKAGDISGTYIDASHQQHGFLWHANGTVTVINRGGGTFAVGVNDSDDIAGYNTPLGSDLSAAFEWSNGTFTPLVYPGSSSNQAYGINNNQVVVGAYFAGSTFGFIETP